MCRGPELALESVLDEVPELPQWMANVFAVLTFFRTYSYSIIQVGENLQRNWPMSAYYDAIMHFFLLFFCLTNVTKFSVMFINK